MCFCFFLILFIDWLNCWWTWLMYLFVYMCVCLLACLFIFVCVSLFIYLIRLDRIGLDWLMYLFVNAWILFAHSSILCFSARLLPQRCMVELCILRGVSWAELGDRCWPSSAPGKMGGTGRLYCFVFHLGMCRNSEGKANRGHLED